MPEKPVIILGAGATKACGGPLTDEILPAALNGHMAHDDQKTMVSDREELLDLTRTFLSNSFNVPLNRPPVTKEDCPSLPMVLSMLRRSVQLGIPLGGLTGDDLVKVRRAIEYAIFAVIEAALREMPAGGDYHEKMLRPLYQRGADPAVISLNYDVIVDNAMFGLSEQLQGMRPPDYTVEIATDRYAQFRAGGTYARLLKIHGSLNWLYCEKCKRLDLFVSEGMRTGKALDELYHSVPFGDAYSCRGTPCRNAPACDGFISPILITPTYVKDYENPHIEKVWAEAQRAMEEADRAVIVGYSLPTDDVEVAMLFKRGLEHLPREKITVVEYVHGDGEKPLQERTPLGRHPTGQRFRSLFGEGLDWHTTGFEGWLGEQSAAGKFPFAA
jgi:hypothetical protein